MTNTHVDVIIIGAGLSGIGMACHLQKELPGKSFLLLERRKAIGGTWDLFRYPGVRSDSDMFTFAYAFRPWMSPTVLAEGARIRDYLQDTAQEFGIDAHIRFGLKVDHAAWSSAQSCWTVATLQEETGEVQTFTCNFLVSCTGYYDYDQGHSPAFPGAELFKGQCIHPQFWPEGLDYSGKKVVVIGSGATAVTLVPNMAKEAAHLTMLQRSPTYIVSVAGYEKIVQVLEKFLPRSVLYCLLRTINIRLQRALFKSARRWPQRVRKFLLRPVQKALGKDFDMRHFTPHYMPWDQRVCMVPDGDLLKAIRSGQASVVTDEIERFVGDGILLKSGQTLQADIVVTATGLKLKTFGGIALSVDAQAVNPQELLSYRAVLMQNLPNFGFILGYTNASWTLKADMASCYLCRLVRYMDHKGLASATPRAPDAQSTDESVMGSLSAGYVQRGQAELPRQGRSAPWRVEHAFEKDRLQLLEDAIDDGLLVFGRQVTLATAQV
jgi:cation diffusion facilitator CzcD-associated flavoprotein CzcO